MQIPAYPKKLLKSEWDKNKGIIAKMRHGETGVGAAMEKLKAVYDAVGWVKLQKATGNTQPNSSKDGLKGITASMAKEALTRLDALHSACTDLAKVAQNARGGLKTDGVVLKVPLLPGLKVPDKIGDSDLDDLLGTVAALSRQFPDQWIYLKECLGKISRGQKVP